jgi:hypothetical protein
MAGEILAFLHRHNRATLIALCGLCGVTLLGLLSL